jgi:hypothetical protein
MLSGIYYDDAANSVSIEYRNRGNSPPRTLMHMIRPSKDDFVAQLAYVNNYAALRAERSAEIMTEMTDILSFLGSVGFLHPNRTRRLFELLTLVLHVTGIIEMRVKHALHCPRPIVCSP